MQKFYFRISLNIDAFSATSLCQYGVVQYVERILTAVTKIKIHKQLNIEIQMCLNNIDNYQYIDTLCVPHCGRIYSGVVIDYILNVV